MTIPYFGEDAVPYLTPEYLRGRADAEPARPAPNATCVEDGDVVLLWDGSNAGEFFQARAGLLASTMVHLQQRDDFDQQYLYYAVKRWESYLKGQTSGSGIPHVDKEVLGKLEIVRFDKKEQTEIACILSTIEAAIEQTEAFIAKQQRIKTGLMQDLLTRGIDEHGNIRSEGTHEFRDSPLGRVPIEWSLCPLSSVVKEPITYGIVQAGPHIENGVPYIRTGDMSGDALQLDGLLRTSEKIAKSYRRSEVHPGDTVFALRATVGKVLPVPKELDRANLTQGTARISPGDQVRGDYLLWFMRTHAVATQLMLVQKGTTFSEVTLAELRDILVAIPEDDGEQKRIAGVLNDQQALIAAEQRQWEKLMRLKAGLMQDLLTGKVRVTKLLEQEAVAS